MSESTYRSGGFFGWSPGALTLPRSIQEMRTLLDTFSPLLNQGLPRVGAVHRNVPLREVDGKLVCADVLVPEGAGPHPVLLYIHGGGWVCGAPGTHEKLAHRFAEAGFMVVNLGYRLAPEDPFPAALQDCRFAVDWVQQEAPRYGGDPTRLAIGGDSAGGNLAAATAVALADEDGAPRLSAALLIYGVFDFEALIQSFEDDDPLSRLSRAMAAQMVSSYLGVAPPARLLSDPRVSPLRAAERMPPSFIVVGGADPLVAQARAFADALEKGGVAHEHLLVEGLPHGFVQMEFFPQTRATIDRMVTFLHEHLALR